MIKIPYFFAYKSTYYYKTAFLPTTTNRGRLQLLKILILEYGKKTEKKLYIALEFKLDLVELAKQSFNLTVARKYNINEKLIFRD